MTTVKETLTELMAPHNIPTIRLQAANSLNDMEDSERYAQVVAARTESTERLWYQIEVKDLSLFCLKLVISAAPAAALVMIGYLSFIILNSVAAQVLGGL